MGIFKKNEDGSKNLEFENQLAEQAKRLGLSVAELINLSAGKSCPKYGTAEILHARKVRGGKIVVFNISEKFRGEKISVGRKALKKKKEHQKVQQAQAATDQEKK